MKRRLVILVGLLAAWSVVVGVRLYEVQVRRYQEFVGQAAIQQRGKVDVRGRRGTIFDSRGRKLAVSVEAESAWADPARISDPARVAQRLSEVLGFDAKRRSELEGRLRSDKGFVWVARKLDREVSKAVRELGIDGVQFLGESRRYYPFRSLLSHVLGYAGLDSQGLAGLESYYEEVIAGSTATRMLIKGGRNGAVLADPSYSFVDPDSGRSLHLTVDASLQHIVETELFNAVDRHQARGGVAILLDPYDSAILAMASFPDFDPNRFADYPPRNLRNQAIADAVEPGSTFKMLTAAAAFESAVVYPEDRFFCENGGIRFGSRYIGDHKAFGDLSFREVIAMSSNVGTIKAALLIEDRFFYDMIRAFGFGRRTGVDLPGESPGILRPLEKWNGLSKAYLSFGHEVAVSPLQLANAFAVVANGGWWHEPYIVRALETEDGLEVLPRPPAIQVLSASTAVTLERVLEDVVTIGTGELAQIQGYRVAGKTGTAEKLLRNGRYSDSLHLVSFAGMVPARRPRLVGLVMLDEPMNSGHGGDVAAPAFAAIARQALLYLGVAPDRDLWTNESAWLTSGSPEAPAVDPDRWADPDRLAHPDRWARSRVPLSEVRDERSVDLEHVVVGAGS